ncbi:hypothetical protein HAHE_10130 [Haloferula helveola]|uniref:TMhelix containing protein n=1 Tax=Haloferula helveola TaxID=490095 RepID=A0ABM7RBR9_9BACT|nr:hypothetical protein HAHE_10130 [Haloferula helveola]
MTPHRLPELQKAYSDAQAVALHEGCNPGREQSAEVEKKLDRLFAVATCMFSFAVGAVTVVGFWLF